MSAIGSPVSFRELHCDKRVLGPADLYALSKINKNYAMAQVHAQGAIADRDLVSQLSRKSFASRTVAEQKLIVQQH